MGKILLSKPYPRKQVCAFLIKEPGDGTREYGVFHKDGFMSQTVVVAKANPNSEMLQIYTALRIIYKLSDQINKLPWTIKLENALRAVKKIIWKVV